VVKVSAEPNAAIKDLSTTTSSIKVDQDVPVEKLKLNLDVLHTYKGDLAVTLTSPSGKSAVVHNRTGGSADNLQGSFDLSQFAGESAKGEWKLTVEDKARADTGTLKSWGLEITPKTPEKPKPSGDPIVVVLDGGVDVKHTDLDSAMWVNPGEIAGDGIDNDNNGFKDDVHGINVGNMNGDVFKGAGTDHGTHVAGIIAAEDNGVGNTGFAAGKAKVMSIGGLYDGADLLTNFERSVDYMVDMKSKGANIRVVNASFGDAYKNPADVARWQAATQKLADADILLVAATANGNGSNMNNVPDMPANIDLPNVLTVAAMDKNNDKLARFSSHGDKVVELAAVGEDVFSTVPGNKHRNMSGTSMATPTVAAAAALMFAANPNLTAAQVRQILVDTVEKDADLNGKVSTGGKLNMAAAVEKAKQMAQPQPAAARTEWF
jgi:subtilisin-like proprotein convertase family protein